MRSDALSLARGEVRDGVAAIEHFREVLVSRRVGPRMLRTAVPEMAAGCAPLIAALESVSSALGSELVRDPEGFTAVRGLIAHAIGRVAELGAALATHAGSTVDARVRLSLESVVKRVSAELAAVLRLIDMLGAPVTSDTMTIDFADALLARRAAARPATPAPPSIQAAVELRTDELTVGDARLLLDLLEHAVAAVVRTGVTSPGIVVETGPDDLPTFTVEAASEKALAGARRLTFEVAMRDELPHELAVVRAAARHAGIALAIHDGGRKVTIAL